VAEARRRGVEVVELDLSIPFTAARARNAGHARLCELHTDVDAVHFFDGDCEVRPGWVAKAQAFLDANPQVGVVFGLQQERHPQASVYNLLFDIEWDTPRGAVSASAGNALCRRALFAALGGFREDLIAGEDPEFCLRVRQAGFLIWHLDEPMVLHDAAMTRFGQWWRRAKRAGYAFAEGATMHGAPPERHFVREARSQLVWGLAIPCVVGLAALLLSPWALLRLGTYPLQVARIAARGRFSTRVNWIYAFFVVLGKFPEAAGALKYYRERGRGAPRTLIEYK